MPGHTYFKTNETNAASINTDILAQFTGGGSTAWFTQVGNPFTTATYTRYLLESNLVDAHLVANPTQKFRLLLHFENNVSGVGFGGMVIYYGSADQIKPKDPVPNDVVIQPGTPSVRIMSPDTNSPNAAREINYRISFTDRGFAFAMWATTSINNKSGQGFICIQRPVNPSTGETIVGGKDPIFAIFRGTDWADTDQFGWGVVREIDLPASNYAGTTNTPSVRNMYKISFDWSHPNLFDNNSHVVKFPYGFATNRHLYLDEMDMMCLVNASAFAGSQEVGITMYGEAEERKYTTIYGDVAYGAQVGNQSISRIVSGARIGILTNGGDF